MEQYQVWAKALDRQAELIKEAQEAKLIYQAKQTEQRVSTPKLRYWLGSVLIRYGERMGGLSTSSISDRQQLINCE